MQNTKLIYIHDPMCSWCWGFRPVFHQILEALPTHIGLTRVLGGLAADSDLPMPEAMQKRLQQTWRDIQERIPGTEFNFDFWLNCAPRRSTYPACRGVIAARQQGAEYDAKMTHAIQSAYYLNAKNPADDSTLVSLARSIGLDYDKFEKSLNATSTQQVLADEIDFRTKLGVYEFPSIVLIVNNTKHHIKVNYSDAGVMLQAINEHVADLSNTA